MSPGMLSNPGMDWGCHDKCITSSICLLKGCRQVRLAEISKELQAHMARFPMQAASITIAINKDGLTEKVEPGIATAGFYSGMDGKNLGPDAFDLAWTFSVQAPFEGFSWVRGNAYEEGIIAKYSTPGLRKHELTRSAKKEQLNAQGMGKFPVDRDKLLDQLYPETK